MPVSYKKAAEKYYGDEYDNTSLSLIRKSAENANKKKNKKLSEAEKERNNALTQVGKGAVTSIATAPFDIAVLAQLPAVGADYLTTKALDKIYDKDTANLGKSFDRIMNTNAALSWRDNVEDFTRKLVGSRDFDKLEGAELAGDVAGQLINPVGAIGKASSLAKAAKLDKTSKVLGKLFDKLKPKNGVAAMAIPGVQLEGSKNVLGSMAAQSALPLGMAESKAYVSDQEGIFGDYRQKGKRYFPTIYDKTRVNEDRDTLGSVAFKEQFRMDKNKKFQKIENPLPLYEINYVDLDKINDYDSKNKELSKPLAALAVTGGLIAATRAKGGALGRKIIDPIRKAMGEDNFSKYINRNFVDPNSVFEGVNTLSEEVLNSLYVDQNALVNTAFRTGILNDNFKLDVSPEITKTLISKINTDSKLSEVYNKFVDTVSDFQDDLNSFNRANKTNITLQQLVDDFTNTNGKSTFSSLFNKNNRNTAFQPFRHGMNKVRDNANFIKGVLNDIKTNPNYKIISDVLDQQSKINNILLDYGKDLGVFSEESVAKMKSNRTLNGLNFYKHRVNVDDRNFVDKVLDFFKTKTITPKSTKEFEARGANKAITNTKSMEEVFSDQFFDEIRYINNEKLKADVISDLEKNQLQKGKDLFDKFKEARQDFAKNIGTDVDGPFFKEVKLRNLANKQTNGTYKDSLINAIELNKKKRFNFEEGSKLNKDLDDLFTVKKKKVSTNNKYDDTGNYIGTEVRVNEPNLGQKLEIIKDSLEDLAPDSLFNHREKIYNSVEDYGKAKKDNEIIIRKDGKELVYEVQPEIKAALELSPYSLSALGNFSRWMNKTFQRCTTGNFNPLFAFKSAKYSTDELFSLFDQIAKELNVDDYSRFGMLKDVIHSYKARVAQEGTKEIVNNYLNAIKGSINDPNIDYTLIGQNLTAKVRNNFLTKLQQEGAYTIRNIDDPTKETKKIIEFDRLIKDSALAKRLNKKFSEKDSAEILKKVNFLQKFISKGRHYLETAAAPVDKQLNAVREAPSIAIIRYFGKKIGALDKKGNIIDKTKLQKLNKVMQLNTSNTHLHGYNNNVLNNFVRNHLPYGNIFIDSLSPKIKGAKIAKVGRDLVDSALDVFDPNVRGIDVFMNMRHRLSKMNDIQKNAFVKGMYYTAVLPAIISYAWNNGNKENRALYDQVDDYSKGKNLMFSNLIPGYNIGIPQDQEVHVVSSLTFSLLDSLFPRQKTGMNNGQDAFDPFIVALGRSFGFEAPILAQAAANLSGYKLNSNIVETTLGDSNVITPISQGFINADESNTKYSNGILNTKVSELINTVLGSTGSMITGAIEEGNIGSKSDRPMGGMVDIGQKMFGSLTSPVKLSLGRTGLKYNKTTQKNIDKTKYIDKLTKIKDKSPKQEEIFRFVKGYVSTYIKDLNKQGKNLRDKRNLYRINGESSYNERSKPSKIDENLNKVNNLIYNHYTYLDKILKSKYNTTLETFMQQYEGQ